MKQYSQNIELVDPQLKNNEPLVKVITAFEDAWSLGHNQIGSKDRLGQLDLFSKLLEQTCREVPAFNEMVECRDASIFMSIPNLLVMETLLRSNNQQEAAMWNDLCSRFKEGFITSAEFLIALSAFAKLHGMKSLLSNLKLQVLEVASSETSSSSSVLSETNQVKNLGMDLSRSQPMEWNEFMTACLAGAE